MEIKVLIDEIEELVTPKGKYPLKGSDQGRVEVIKNGAILIDENGKIVDYGSRESILSNYRISPSTYVLSAKGKTVIPGLIDPHTHLVYKGCRHWELKERLMGKGYIEILKKGGGILSTVRETRNSEEEELYQLALKRLNKMLSYGTTAVEIKSGYGLSLEQEEKILRVIDRLKKESQLNIVSTFLGAHAVPSEYLDEPDTYVDLIIKEMLPKFTPLADFVDVFLEEGAFGYDSAKRILKRAKEIGYGIKIHADEITDSKGACLAAELSAQSADHLLFASNECLKKMKDSRTIAVLLPSTAYFLKKPFAKARKMIEMGIPVAIATDHNPGTSPIYSQLFNMSLSVFFMEMQPEEALVAATLNAACAIDKGEIIGSIERGKRADIVLLNAHSFMHIFYETGHNIVDTVILGGKVVLNKGEVC